MSNLRIAQLAPPWLTVPPSGYGGIEWVVAALCDELVARGHEVTLYAPGGSSSAARIVSPFEHALGTDRIGQAFPELIQALSCYTQADGYDLVHDHCGAIGPALGVFSSRPVLVTLHGAFVDEARHLYSLIGPRLQFVAVSDAQRQSMPDLPYVATIPNGIDVDQFPFRDDKDHYLLYLGRFTPEKGAHAAIDVAHQLGIPLVLAGKAAEPHEKEYLATTVLPSLRPEDTYLGEVSEHRKRELYAGARTLLFPITWPEPFGLVMTEAMACGTPVVAFRHGSVPEVVDHGRTGFIVDSVDEMVEAVRRIDDVDPAACRKHVEEHFSATAMVDGYEEAYRRLLDQAGGRA